jgi:hypothetical protein
MRRHSLAKRRCSATISRLLAAEANSRLSTARDGAGGHLSSGGERHHRRTMAAVVVSMSSARSVASITRTRRYLFDEGKHNENNRQ